MSSHDLANKDLDYIEKMLEKESMAVCRPETRDELLITHLFFVLSKQVQFLTDEFQNLNENLKKIVEKVPDPSSKPGPKPKKDGAQ